MMTLAPAPARASATARPMPTPPPVMRATRPVRSKGLMTYSCSISRVPCQNRVVIAKFEGLRSETLGEETKRGRFSQLAPFVAGYFVRLAVLRKQPRSNPCQIALLSNSTLAGLAQSIAQPPDFWKSFGLRGKHQDGTELERGSALPRGCFST